MVFEDNLSNLEICPWQCDLTLIHLEFVEFTFLFFQVHFNPIFLRNVICILYQLLTPSPQCDELDLLGIKIFQDIICRQFGIKYQCLFDNPLYICPIVNKVHNLICFIFSIDVSISIQEMPASTILSKECQSTFQTLMLCTHPVIIPVSYTHLTLP